MRLLAVLERGLVGVPREAIDAARAELGTARDVLRCVGYARVIDQEPAGSLVIACLLQVPGVHEWIGVRRTLVQGGEPSVQSARCLGRRLAAQSFDQRGMAEDVAFVARSQDVAR